MFGGGLRYYPLGDIPIADKTSSVLSRVLYLVRWDYLFFDYLMESIFFIYIFPFSLLGFFLFHRFLLKNYMPQLVFAGANILFFLIVVPIVLIESDYVVQIRYVFLCFLILLPIGVKSFFYTLEAISNADLNLGFGKEKIVVIILSFSILIASCMNGLEGYEEFKKPKVRGKSYEWVQENAPEDSIILARKPYGVAIFTDFKGLSLSRNVNDTVLESLIIAYSVDFVIISEKSLFEYNSDEYAWVSQAFSGEYIIQLGDVVSLELVHTYNDYDGKCWTYKVDIRD